MQCFVIFKDIISKTPSLIWQRISYSRRNSKIERFSGSNRWGKLKATTNICNPLSVVSNVDGVVSGRFVNCPLKQFVKMIVTETHWVWRSAGSNQSPRTVHCVGQKAELYTRGSLGNSSISPTDTCALSSTSNGRTSQTTTTSKKDNLFLEITSAEDGRAADVKSNA